MQYNCTQCGRFLDTSSRDTAFLNIDDKGQLSGTFGKIGKPDQLHCSSNTCPIRDIVAEDLRAEARHAYEEAERQRDSSWRTLKKCFAIAVLGLLLFLKTDFGPLGVLIVILCGGWSVGTASVLVRALYIMNQNSDAAPADTTGNSQVRSRIIEMELDLKTGLMSGRIWSGPRTGQKFSEMTKAQCQRLYQECTSSDPDGARLLEAYIAQRFA